MVPWRSSRARPWPVRLNTHPKHAKSVFQGNDPIFGSTIEEIQADATRIALEHGYLGRSY
jgi:hypothetical protein